MAIEVLRPGPLTTVQDLGRAGHAAEGYPECGACDKYALRLANLLCGNDEDQAALECTLSGPCLRFDAPAIAAFAGAKAVIHLNGVRCPADEPIYIPAGGELEVGDLSDGLRGCLAVRGGVAVPPLLDSRSTDLKCRLGGHEGRALRAGDRLPVGTADASVGLAEQLAGRARRIPRGFLSHAVPLGWLGEERMPILRAVPGPQDDAFTEAGLMTFARGIYRMSPDSNRMAARFLGERIKTRAGVDIVSDGILEGAVQISADGQPIVMLADHQTTGGYAKIATVLTCDVPALAQLRPGQAARFRLVDRAEAMRAMRMERQRLSEIRNIMKDGRMDANEQH